MILSLSQSIKTYLMPVWWKSVVYLILEEVDLMGRFTTCAFYCCWTVNPFEVWIVKSEKRACCSSLQKQPANSGWVEKNFDNNWEDWSALGRSRRSRASLRRRRFKPFKCNSNQLRRREPSSWQLSGGTMMMCKLVGSNRLTCRISSG